jgi:hypothetical protein
MGQIPDPLVDRHLAEAERLDDPPRDGLGAPASGQPRRDRGLEHRAHLGGHARQRDHVHAAVGQSAGAVHRLGSASAPGRQQRLALA